MPQEKAAPWGRNTAKKNNKVRSTGAIELAIGAYEQ